MKNKIYSLKEKIHTAAQRESSLSVYSIITGLALLLIVSGPIKAQTPVLGFENWSGLTTSNYDSVLKNYYNIPNAQNGQPDGWNSYYGAYSPNDPLIPSINYYGVVKIDGAQAVSGSAAIMLQTWYFYGRSTITYEDTISSIPVSITGRYKRITEITINDTLHDGFSKGYSYVLSTANDTLYKGEITFTDTSAWTFFQMNLQPYSTSSSPVDRIFIAFVNDSNMRTCVEQGVCDLLWLDEIALNMGTTSVGITNGKQSDFIPVPNPTKEMVQIRRQNETENADYMITDNSGRTIQNGQLNSGEHSISLAQFPTGIYHIRLIEKGKVMNQRVVKE